MGKQTDRYESASNAYQNALNKYAVARLLTTKDSTAIDNDNVLQINSDMFIDNALDVLKLTSSHESTGMSTDDERSEW